MAEGHSRDSEHSNDEFYGDPMNEEPDNQSTRIYIQNLNGLSWDNEGGRWPYICEAVDAIQADIACFSELNVDTNNYNIRRTMETICQKQFLHNCLVMSSSTHKTTSIYKPGGTAILARNHIIPKIKTHTRDRMGRWTSISLTTATSRKVRIISAYQVCQQSSPGTNTAASHQTAHIITESSTTGSTTRITPRQAFIQDLQSFIRNMQEEEEDIILVGDFNDDITDPMSGMDQLATTCGLVDLFSVRTGSPNLPATYQRGTKRLDFVLISPSLINHVKAAGYDPFGYRIPSDHRGMYVDLDTDAVFQQPISEMAPADKRDFVSTSPGVITKYVTSKMAYLNDHRFFDRLGQLEGSTVPNHDLAESLDRDFQRASSHAARSCSRKKQTPWSPKLAEAWAELHLYRLVKSSLRTTANYDPAIKKLQEQWPQLPRRIPENQEELHQCYCGAVNKLKQIRQEAQTLRDEHLSKRAELYQHLDENGKAKIVQRLIRAESQRRVYQKIRYLRNQDGGTLGLSSLKIPRNVPITETEEIKRLPDSPEYWETITAPPEIESLLLHRNQHHFGQAEGTPFTLPPLQVEVGYKADGLAADLILSGQYDSRNTSDATRLLISHLQARTIEVLDGKITEEDVLGKLRNWKESTTTSPSGIHLGHYHCAWRDPQLSCDDPSRATIIDFQKHLLRATVTLLNYALQFGHTYQRWTKVVNVMLQKDPGNPRIHRLRIIHLYEADYNLLLAIKWRQAMYHAEEKGLLNNGLYGSRPGRSAHDPALMEVLQHEIYRMSMKAGINFDLDATSCYDRILTNVASLASRRVGMDKTVVNVNMQTLEHAKYHLKTNLGISQGHYHHTPDHPIHGTGQGSGNSPTIWCFVCSALFDAFESQAHGATFTSYDQNQQLSMYMIGFVDDCAQRVNKFSDFTQPTNNALMKIMTEDAQLWNDLLWASGGALEQQKCSFHLIQSDWNSNGHPFLKGNTEGTHIYLLNNGIRTPTHQMSNYTAHKTLGCFINPAYNNRQTWRNLQAKNDKFSQLLETNYFTRSEAWTFYTAIYLPSITYSSPITPLTKSQCNQMDARFLRTLIPRCGYNRNMASAVRYAPLHMGGAGFRQLYVEQGALLTQQLMKFLNSPETVIGQLLLMTISWTQAFLGTSQLFLTEVHQSIPPVGPSLLLDVRQFLRTINGSINLQQPPVPELLRIHDRHIMDIVLHQSQWTTKQVVQINSCRRFLQAQTLADITTIQGTRIQPHAINGMNLPGPSTIRGATFNQKRPSDAAWRAWKKFLSTISDKHAVLYQPLGNWRMDITHMRHWPSFLYNYGQDALYSHYRGSQYYLHQRIEHQMFAVRPTKIIMEPEGYPTATIITMNTLRPVLNHSPQHLPVKHSYRLGSRHILLDPWEWDLLQHCSVHAPWDIIGKNVSDLTIISCSDGSVLNDRGSFGFVISTAEGVRLLSGKGPAPGTYPNSFRSEAYGVLATMRWLHHALREFHPINRLTLHHYLDNKSVIKRINSAVATTHQWPNQQLLPEHDVISEIAYTLKAMPVPVEMKWVKGHQDDITPYQQLNLAAQLNCDADQQANDFASSMSSQDYVQVHPFPHSPSQLRINHQPITSHVKRRIREAATVPRLHDYLKQKFKWSTATFNLVDWTNYESLLKKYKKQWTTLVKHLHDISPTGHIAHRNNCHLPHECPACASPYEDNTHVIICRHASRSEWRQKTMEKVSQYSPNTSDPHLLDILRDGLTRFHRELDLLRPEDYPESYRELITHQNEIGWHHLYRGRWCFEWRLLQAQYIERQGGSSPYVTSGTWTMGLGRMLIDQWLELWQLRNNQRHGQDQENQRSIREQALYSELKHLYTYRSRVCPTDKNLFHSSADEHIANHPSLDAIENWIFTYRTAIEASVAQAVRLGITANRSLLEYPAFNPMAGDAG